MLTINEVRIREGLPIVPGGDEILIPTNYMYLSQRNKGTPTEIKQKDINKSKE